MRLLSPDPEEPDDPVVEGSLRPQDATPSTSARPRSSRTCRSCSRPPRAGGGGGPHPAVRPARPGQDHARDDRGARARRERPVYLSGPAVERAGDLAAILTSLDERDVLFIDEVHRLNRAVEEILYPAMEDFALDVMIGKGPSARSLRLSLKPFTVVGATTRAGRISSPLRDRFGATYRLDFYTEDELAEIVERSAEILDVPIDAGRHAGDRPAWSRNAAHREPAAQARARPRPGARRRHDRRGHCARRDASDGDRRRGPRLGRPQAARGDRPEVRLVARSASPPWRPCCREETDTIEDVHEPFLLRLGFIDRTPQGRIATDLGRAHLSALGYEIPPPRRTDGRSRDSGTTSRHGCRSRRRSGRGVTAPFVSSAARFEVTSPPPADGSTRARTATLTLPHGVVRDAAVHAGRHECDGQGALAGRSQGRRRLDHPRQHLPPLSPARATSGSRGSAGCIGSWTGTARS